MRKDIFKSEKKEEIIRKKNQIGPEWDLLEEELIRSWGPDFPMINFCISRIDILKSFPNGEIFSINREEIKKDFCFPHGCCGVSDEEEEKAAIRMADRAKNDSSYFLERNLMHLNNLIAEIEKEDSILYSRPYFHKSEKYREIIKASNWDLREVYKDGRRITEEEKQIFLSAVKEEREKFKKRLETYLKKYGLSKVRTWTFLSD